MERRKFAENRLAPTVKLVCHNDLLDNFSSLFILVIRNEIAYNFEYFILQILKECCGYEKSIRIGNHLTFTDFNV